MKILYRYLLGQVLTTAVTATAVLTLILVLWNLAQRVIDLLVNNDIPLSLILKMVALLIPQALTLTLPWGLLVAVLIVFGRMSHDLELQSIRASGFGLIPLIAPIVLLSLTFTLFSFYNNAFLAPQTMTTFKRSLIDLGRNNPTVFLRAQEPIDQFDDLLIYIDKKYGNIVEGVNIWELNDDNIPVSSLRAEKGTISANLQDMTLNVTLTNVRQEMRDRDHPTDLGKIQAGLSAGSFPLPLPLGKLLDDTRINQDITIMPFIQLGSSILSPSGLINNPLPLLTELQRRLAFSFASFTFVIIGIPLAITAHRRETAAGIILSLVVAVSYYLLIVLATALKEKAAAHPELIVWMPNLIFQALGFFLLWKMNRQPV